METKRMVLTEDDNRKGPFWICHKFLKDFKTKIDALCDNYDNLGCPLFDPFLHNSNFNVSFKAMNNHLLNVNDRNRAQALNLWSAIEKLIMEEFNPGIATLQLHVLLSAFFDEDRRLMVDLFYTRKYGKTTERTAMDFFNLFARKHIFVAFYKVSIYIIINYYLLL